VLHKITVQLGVIFGPVHVSILQLQQGDVILATLSLVPIVKRRRVEQQLVEQKQMAQKHVILDV
jgi:hypothetical protein